MCICMIVFEVILVATKADIMILMLAQGQNTHGGKYERDFLMAIVSFFFYFTNTFSTNIKNICLFNFDN